MTKIIAKEYTEFLEQLKDRIAASRYKAARTVNKELLLLYHYIGTRILEKQKSQGWGAKVIEQLSRDLKAEFPEMKGFGIANLHNMRRFAEIYPNPEFLQQVAGILPWYHHVVLMERVKDHEARLFYVRNASEYGWSRAIMIHQIELGLHKRQGKAITNFKEKLPYPTSDLANQTLKDPYIFDFLSIGKDAHEREIEKGLVAHIEKFLLELGAGFSFVGRQYHLTVRQKDYYLDLKYCPSLPPLIAGGMIGSMLLLAVCTLVGILLLIDRTFFDKIYCNIYDQKKINEKAEFFDKLSKCILPLIAGAVVSFGVGAGLAALGLESPLAIAVLAAVACKVIMSLFSAITERFSSPPTPPGSSVDSDVKVDNTSPNPSYVLPN